MKKKMKKMKKKKEEEDEEDEEEEAGKKPEKIVRGFPWPPPPHMQHTVEVHLAQAAALGCAPLWSVSSWR